MNDFETYVPTSERDLLRLISDTYNESEYGATSIALETPSSGSASEVLMAKGKALQRVTLAFRPTLVSFPYEWLEEENAQLRMENYLLRQRINAIEERIANIEALIPREKIIVLREISREEAKKEILDLFSKGKTLYYSDIAEQLRLDLEPVVDICNELQDEGKIEVVDGSVSSR